MKTLLALVRSLVELVQTKNVLFHSIKKYQDTDAYK